MFGKKNNKVIFVNYLLMFGTLFLGISGIIGTILAYIKSKEYSNNKYISIEDKKIQSHFKSIFKTSIVFLLLFVISWILIFTIIGAIIGYPLLLMSTLYFYGSNIIGFIKLNQELEN